MRTFTIFLFGFIGALLWMSENDSFWTIFVGALCFVVAICLYCKWNVNGELDENPYL